MRSIIQRGRSLQIVESEKSAIDHFVEGILQRANILLPSVMYGKPNVVNDR